MARSDDTERYATAGDRRGAVSAAITWEWPLPARNEHDVHRLERPAFLNHREGTR